MFARINGQIALAILIIGLFTLAPNVCSVSSTVPWWNLDFNHRISLTFDAGSLERTDYPFTLSVDFSKYTAVQVDKGSIRVIDPSGNEVPSQTQWFSDTFVNIYFGCSIPANSQKTYYIYFATGTTMADPHYDTDLYLWSGATKTVGNSKYQITWDSKANAIDIRIKAFSASADVHKYADNIHHSLFYVNYQVPVLFGTRWDSTTDDSNSASVVTVLTSGPEIVEMYLVQQWSGDSEHKSATIYFYPQQGYFLVDETTVLVGRTYSADIEWSYIINCGSSPTSYADLDGNYYTAENPNAYGLGLVWLSRDEHLQWKGFSGIGDVSGELRWTLPAQETGISTHYSKYAVLLDGANIRADTGALFDQLSNPPSLWMSGTAETQTVTLNLLSSKSYLKTSVNQQYSFEITVQNDGNIEAKDVHLSSYGVPSSWIQFSTDRFSLAPNAQEKVTVTVTPTYVGGGDYNLTISAAAAAGNVPTVVVGLKVKPAPIPEFTYTPQNATIKDTVNFVDQSSSPEGQITSWLWNFGDETASTLENPPHAYSRKGNFAVTLTVTDNDGAQSSVSHTVVIHNLPPIAAFYFNPTNPHPNTDVQFTDNSTDPENMLTSWHWNFGDGRTSDIQNSTHSFISEGNFNVTLTVADDEGATSTYSMIVSVAGSGVSTTLWIAAGIIIVVLCATVSALYVRRRRGKGKT